MMQDNGKDFIVQNIGLFCCPKCRGSLESVLEGFTCRDCGQAYGITDGIPSFFWPNEWDPGKEDVTEKIRSFYEETPFPDYDEFDNPGMLIEKARKGLFARLLDEQIPYGTRILECGCGTGQLTNFLSIANRTVIGTDICMNSLRMADEFRRKNGLGRAHFCQMNLFRPAFRPNSFDLVIANGVLHHTSDPYLAFRTISELVRPGGFILVGLYHRYGRLATNLRRIIFRATGNRFRFLDRRTINREISRSKRNAWFMDQYRNPHESRHTFTEVFRWLDETGFTYVHSIPRTVPFVRMNSSERLFEQDRKGNGFERFLVNLGMIFSGHREGGFFIVIAKKQGP